MNIKLIYNRNGKQTFLKLGIYGLADLPDPQKSHEFSHSTSVPLGSPSRANSKPVDIGFRIAGFLGKICNSGGDISDSL